MAQNDIVGVTPRRFVRTTLPAKLAPGLDDLVDRDFSPGTPNRRYAGDITYVPTGEGWLYVASVLDLGSRRLAGWAMADNMRTSLVTSALQRAVALRGCVAGAIFHSDLGSQYLSGEYRALCRHLGLRQSAGRVGTCFDNSAAESFWSSLKRELVHRYLRYPIRGQSRHHCMDLALQHHQAPLDHRVHPARRVGNHLLSGPAGRITMCPAGGGRLSVGIRLALGTAR
jgi:transposase InsO family protein